MSYSGSDFPEIYLASFSFPLSIVVIDHGVHCMFHNIIKPGHDQQSWIYKGWLVSLTVARSFCVNFFSILDC